MKTMHESITKFAFFDGMQPAHLSVLPEGAKTVQFKAGDVLFRERDPAGQFYLIESGKISAILS